MADTWYAILPPVLAIGLAIGTRQVHLSLFAGVWLGWSLIAGGDPLRGMALALEGCVRVFQDAGNTRVILFSALVGALIALTKATGGITGFVRLITTRGRVRTRRRATLLSFGIGVVVFVESSITSLVNGAVCRPVFDRLRISREKLAYLCDSTSAPICILLPLNAWGAYCIGLLGKEGYREPTAELVATIPYNLYAWAALAVALWVASGGRDLGPMRAAEARARAGEEAAPDDGERDDSAEFADLEPPEHTPRRAVNFLVPIGVMVAMMPVGLLITGDGDLIRGSGSTAVLWAVLAGTAAAAILGIGQRLVDLRRATAVCFRGLGALLPLAALMILAFAIGDVTKELETGVYVAGLAKSLITPAILPTVLFGAACLVAFSTGTSWGTFAIMIPLAVPLAQQLGANESVALAAVLSGGVFGDHCSPISDTTIIASLAAGTGHIAHVRTQMPYALLAAGVAAAGFLLLGLV